MGAITSSRTRTSQKSSTCRDVSGEAKPYQIRQLLRLVERYSLTLEDGDVRHYHINVFYSEEDGGYRRHSGPRSMLRFWKDTCRSSGPGRAGQGGLVGHSQGTEPTLSRASVSPAG